MEEILVSILIPVYNRVNLVGETIESAINQTYKNIEIIICDNCSTDGTYDVIYDYAARDQRVKVYRNKQNIGPVLNWKRCIELATGVYAKILWSDDLIDREFISRTIGIIAENPKVGFVVTGTKIFCDNPLQIISTYFLGEPGLYGTEKFIKDLLLGVGDFPYSPGNAIFRRADLHRNLVVDVPNSVGSNFKMHAMGPDILIYLLTAQQYPLFGVVNDYLAFFRAHSGSITISTRHHDLLVLYNLAKAYFVENHVANSQFRRKFNGVLLLSLISAKNGIGVGRLKDFYPRSNPGGIDYLYFCKLIARKIAGKAARVVKKPRASLLGNPDSVFRPPPKREL